MFGAAGTVSHSGQRWDLVGSFLRPSSHNVFIVSRVHRWRRVSGSSARSAVLFVSDTARSNSARASSIRPSFDSRSPRTLGSK